MSLLQSIILAIVDGITEFLPVSSTGHMIIASSIMGIEADPFVKLFTVAIELGAILSVVVLYWKRFFQSFNFYWKIGVAFIPSVIAGLIFKEYVDALLERVDVVGYALLLGGIFFLVMDKIFKENEENQEISYPKAFKIGLFQVIAMIPGVSRSAPTIIGGLSQKLTRKNELSSHSSSQFQPCSQQLLISIYKFFTDGYTLSSSEINTLIIGNIAAFIVAMIAIKSFISFLTKYGFKVFGYYRIVVGITILGLYYFGSELAIL